MSTQLSDDEILEYAKEAYAHHKKIPVEQVTRAVLEKTAAGVQGWAAVQVSEICSLPEQTTRSLKAAKFTPEPGTPAANKINIDLAEDFERDRQAAFQSYMGTADGHAGTFDIILALLSDAQADDREQWVSGSNLGSLYYQKIGLKDKARYKAVISSAVDLQFVETIDITPPGGSPLPQFRITEKGWDRLG
jgi:hypothetical protein